VAGVALLVLVGLSVGAYFLWRPKPKPPELPGPGSPTYAEYARAFEVGTAALAVDKTDTAQEQLTAAVEKIPEEPAAWANRGILFLRDNRLDEAARDLNRAHELAPGSPEIEALLGLLARQQGKFDEGVAHLRKALQQRPQDLPSLYALAQLVAQAAGPDSDAEYQRLMEDILSVQPNNLVVLVERAQVAARRRDADALRDTLGRLGRLSAGWSAQARNQLEKVKKAAERPLPGEVPDELTLLGNVLKPERGYQPSARAVNPNPRAVGEPLVQFLRLAPLRNRPAPPDVALTFTAAPLGADKADLVLPVWLTGEGNPAVFAADARQVRRIDAAGFAQPFPSGAKAVAPSAHGVLPLDWDNDQRTDLLLAGAGGLRFWQQKADGSFADVTAKTGLPADVLGGDYFGAWAADVDADGDLDVVLAPRAGPPLVLRNNGDGTFKVLKPFAGVEAVRAFAWADLDNDGASDAAFLDAQGQLHVFANERAGVFRARPAPGELGRVVALTAADVDGDSVFDLALLRADGALLRLSDRNRGQTWTTAEVGTWPEFPTASEPGSVQLIAADLDNNGGLDLLAASPRGTRVWLNEAPGKYTPLPAAVAGRVFAAEDVTGNGRLDLLGLSDDGKPVRLANRGGRDYHWQDVRVRAKPGKEAGDQRINSFAVGGEVEALAGLLVQKQLIRSPRTHVGLGEHTSIAALRFVWPNGAPQVEFEKPANAAVVVEQRLKGSCPFLFAHDGRRVRFVTDFMWSTPLGMYINGQDKGGFLQTTDWVKVRGDQLAARDGHYDLRVQANLWETHFFDHLALIVVDHPPDTEVFTDERFALTPTVPQVYLTTPPRPVARAWDHRGTDVTELVRDIDGRYLDTCGRGRYQGVTNDHWVEVDLGEDAPREGPVWLLARGWVHPTDSSINVALGQGQHEAPRPLVLEVPDGQGGWKVGRPALGFPAGKNKTILVRLDGITGKGVTRRFRLRTNMEIFWDALHYATGLEAAQARQQRLAPTTAELRYRGILEMKQANASSPEVPVYDTVARTTQRWRDLEGYYTRYGDVRELLAKVDDRYVIANAGDEIALTFAAPAGPPPGWKRDFLFVSDGWVKDGDFNTAFSKTVLPLPAHNLKSYDRPPKGLEDDPVYRHFPDDWRKYHTRYVTPYDFDRGLRLAPRP
jgi:tetratricopeptide (TPR) repeat protein